MEERSVNAGVTPPLREIATAAASLANDLEKQRDCLNHASDAIRDYRQTLDHVHEVVTHLAVQAAQYNADLSAFYQWWMEKKPQIRAAFAIAKTDRRFKSKDLRKLVRLVELVLHEYAVAQGALAGKKSAEARGTDLAARRRKWEALRGEGNPKSVCDDLTARAFKVKTPTIVNQRSADRTKRTGWKGDN